MSTPPRHRCRLALGVLVALAAALCPRPAQAAAAAAPAAQVPATATQVTAPAPAAQGPVAAAAAQVTAPAPAAQGPVAAAQVPAAGAAAVRASLAHLQLGVDREAELTLELPEGARGVRVQASCGSVEALQQVAPGRWTARYRPPAPLYPQLAIIAVTALDGEAPVHAWTVLPLWGKGRAEVRTRPLKATVLRIGENSFGPVRADAAGVARVAVVVPPGFREGWAGEQRVDLQLPPVPRVYAMLGQERVSADEEARVPVRIYAVTPEGAPRTGGTFRLEVDRGTLEPLRARGPGVYETHWRLPPGPRGPVALRGTSLEDAEAQAPEAGAAATGERAPATAAAEAKVMETAAAQAKVMETAAAGAQAPETAAVQAGALAAQAASRRPETFGARVLVEPGPARSARVALQPEELVAGAVDALSLRVEAFDRGGNQVEAPLQVRWALGETQALRSSAAEPALLRLSAPVDFRGLVSAALQVLGPEGELLAAREVPLRPGEPARLDVQGGAELHEADGRTPVVLRLDVRDRFGNPVREPAPRVLSSTDRVAAPVPTGAGTWEVRFVPELVAQERPARLEVQAGGLSAHRALRLLPHRPQLSVAGRAGLLSNLGTVSSATAGLQLHLWPRLLWEDLGLSVDLGYLPLGAGGGEGLEGVESSAGAWLLALGPSWRLRPRAGLELWVGAGPSLGRLSARTALGGGTPVESSGGALGAQAWVGVSRRWGPGAPFLELRGVALSDPQLPTLRGSLRALSLQVGYRFDLH